MHRILITLYLYALLLVLTLACICFSPFVIPVWGLCIGSVQRATRGVIWVYGRCWVWGMRVVNPVKNSGAFHEHIKPPCILVANHASFLDVYLLGGCMPVDNICIIVRSWPFRIPFYAPFMHMAGYLNSEAAVQKNGLDFFGAAKQELEQNATLLFFPEGRRTRTGELGRFYSGAFKIAVEAGVPVVPICISGTHGLMPPGTKWMHPSPVELRCLPAVDPAPYMGTEDGHMRMRKDVKALMKQALQA